MRVLWNNHRDLQNPRSGGAERTIAAVGSRLVRSGHDVELVTAEWPGAVRVEWQDGIRIHRFPGSLGPHLTTGLVARRVRPDVTVDDLAHVIPWMSPQLGVGPGVAFFRHLHRRTLGGQVSRPVARVLSELERHYPWIYRRWEFAVESTSSRSDLELLGVSPSRISVIPPGVDLERFCPGTRSETPSVVLFAGLRRYKRPDHALRAFGLLARAGVRASMTVVGASPNLPELQRVAKDSGGGDSVRFVGRLDDSELASTIRSAWANVNCSTAEGWGYSILEAAASGVPTAAYDVPGLREGTGNGAAGILVPDGNIPALAEALRRLLEDNAAWSVRCREFAERYRWDVCARAWEQLLSRVSRPRGSP